MSLISAPATWLVLLVGASTALRGAIAVRVPSPWILPDEIVYSELAKSIADGHRPAIRGIPAFGWGEIYPTLIAPAWALFESPVHSYHAALVISAVIMSLAAVPAYFLARLFVSREASFLAAAMTVLVPSMAYTGVVMTENAFYPVFLLAVLLIARAVRRPTIGSQALALVGLGLITFTRIQGLALAGAYLVAVALFALTGPRSERIPYLRRFVPTAAFLLAALLAPVIASVARGDGALGWLGARSSTFAEFHPREVPEWFVYLAADLILYVAVVPVAATMFVIGHGLSRRASERVRLFAAVALPTFVAMLGSVSLVSASLDVDGTENLNERYIFYVVPLALVGLALWISEGLPRRRRWTLLIVSICCVLVVVLPIDRLEYNAGFQSVGLLPWIGLSLPGLALALVVGAFALTCGVVWMTCRRDRVGRLWLLVGVWMMFVGALTVGSNHRSARGAAHAFEGLKATWVDDALPAGAEVAVLWDENAASPDSPDPLYFWVTVTEQFNKDVGDVYRIGPPTYYEVFLPTVPVGLRADGTVIDRHGATLHARYVLTSCRTPIQGNLVAEAPRGALRLVDVGGAVRRAAVGSCRRDAP
jgi:MFS family permease